MKLKWKNHCENADDYRPLFGPHSLKHRSELSARVQVCAHRLTVLVHEGPSCSCLPADCLQSCSRSPGRPERERWCTRLPSPPVHPDSSVKYVKQQSRLVHKASSPASEPQGEKSCEHSRDFIQQKKVYSKFESLQLM